ncbi:MAG: hypothetical protein J5W83_15060, partial [Candidatus Accumulibacter sp.]|uniref:hypothetical protein n=1 Tax=Accumulibacter sp. TaxID=2053492 RepID=UPI001B0C269D
TKGTTAVKVSAPPSPTVASNHRRRDGPSVTTNEAPWQAVWFMLISLVGGLFAIAGLADFFNRLKRANISKY